MGKAIWVAVTVCGVVGLLSVQVGGADLSPTPREFLIPRANIKVDGDLTEWSLEQTGYELSPTDAAKTPAIVLLSNDPDNPIKGPKDLSGRVALAWDKDYLFIAAVVTDEELRGVKPGRPHNVGPPGWQCDSVMLRVHSFRQRMRSNSPHTETPMLALRYEVPMGGRGRLIDGAARVLDGADLYWKLPIGSVFASRETPSGYQVEAAVPWKSLNYHPQAGEPLLCAFLLADIDEGEALNQLGWHFDRDPRKLAPCRLLGRPEATGLLSLAPDSVRPGERLTVKYQVDARTTAVQIERLLLIDPEEASVSLPIDVTVPKGQTAADVIVVEKTPTKPGRYRAELEVKIDGETVALAQGTLDIVQAASPAPVVSNAPGELHHYRPDRVPHSAFEDFRRGVVRHGFVNDRSGYERYILTHVKDYVDREMDPAIERKDKNIAYKMLMTYTLFKLTGEQKYADWTRRGLEVAMANQKQQLDLHLLFPLTEVRYYVWLHDPKTALAPPNIEADFQNIWAQVAAEPESWMFAEWGYHNRCWHRLMAQKIARYFAQKVKKPVSPRIDEYIAWHDPKHAHFGATTDNSSGYHWVGFRYPIFWHLATDSLPELAKNAAWVAALHRWRRYSSPSGAVPNFGDTSCWGSGAGRAMANFELMATLSGDGRFRWQAHRIAEYLYNHFWPRHDQYHLVRDRTSLCFCRAWLRADDSVAPVEPERNSQVTFRTRCVEPTEEEKAAWPGGRSSLKLLDEQVPDKLILTSGNDPNALWGLVELIDLGGHCGRLPGHIITSIQHDAALLVGPGYNEESCDLNNIMWLEDFEGIAPEPTPMRTEVPEFVEDPAVTYARIRVRRFQQLPVTYRRDIVFVKNSFMLVKDSVTFDSTMKARLGPCWQTRDLGPQCGDDWFNTYYEYLYLTGLGLGRGVHAFRNPAWDLIIRFAPRDDTRITVLDRYDDNPWRPSPTQLRQSWSGIAEKGDTKTFTTILLPHGPAFDVTQFANWAEFLIEKDETTLVRVRAEFDNIHHFQETHWLLLQEQPTLVSQEGFSSDAALALVSIDRRGNVRPAVIVDGTALSLNGKDLVVGARRPKAESVYEVKE